MRKNGLLFFGSCMIVSILAACSSGSVDPEERIELLIDNMYSQAYDFKGTLHAETAQDTLKDMLVLDGSFVPDKGYALHADVRLPGFKTESDILHLGDELFYKMPESDNWKPTTNQDLRMLGILYKDSPADLFRTMKETVLSVEPTEDDNVFQVTLDRNKYMETTEKAQEEVIRLPQVDIQSHDFPFELVENPVVDVEVDLDQNVIRSFTLHYAVRSSLNGSSEQPVQVTYEMEMSHFNEDQTLPEI